MELGEKIRQWRLEAGLSQRELCGEEITRNMLSLIENGAAKPSMKTLAYLAQRLDKPLSHFLDEDARSGGALAESEALLDRAEEALASGRELYVRELLERTEPRNPGQARRRLLLLGRLPGADLGVICARLPSLDEELLLRARWALESGERDRCGALLAAAEDRKAPRWNLLMGQLHMKKEEYSAAAICLHRAEEQWPEKTAPLLEHCYRELGDFRLAYEYACRQKATR